MLTAYPNDIQEPAMQAVNTVADRPQTPTVRRPIFDTCTGAPGHGEEHAGISAAMSQIAERLPVKRRVVHAGDRVYAAGEAFGQLFVLNAGFYKTINTSADGREQVVGLHFRGDWLGFDGIATGHYTSDAVALETGQVWALRYDELLQASVAHPELLAVLHGEMSRQIMRDRDSMLSLCTLQVDARVADFLRYWAMSLARRGMRTDQIVLQLTRTEIGNYLGMTLESVSRALSRLARGKLIRFVDAARREIQIPDLAALGDFIQAGPRPAAGAWVQ